MGNQCQFSKSWLGAWVIGQGAINMPNFWCQENQTPKFFPAPLPSKPLAKIASSELPSPVNDQAMPLQQKLAQSLGCWWGCTEHDICVVPRSPNMPHPSGPIFQPWGNILLSELHNPGNSQTMHMQRKLVHGLNSWPGCNEHDPIVMPRTLNTQLLSGPTSHQIHEPRFQVRYISLAMGNYDPCMKSWHLSY